MVSLLSRVWFVLLNVVRSARRLLVVGLRTGRAVVLVLALVACCTAALWAADSVIISEFMAANARALVSERRLSDDWIELRNTGSNTVNLENWSLTTNAKKPRQWIFPKTNLPAGGHLMV